MEKRRKKSTWIALVVMMMAGAFLAACSQTENRDNASVKTEGSTDKVSEKNTDKVSEESTGKVSEENENRDSETSFDDYVNQVSELVKLNWPAMNRVWPGYDYTRHNFLIFYLDEEGAVKEAKLLNVDGNRNLEKKEYENITPPNPEGYDQISFEGMPSIVISVDDNVMKNENSVNELYKMATHEMVHFYYQKDVKASADSSRSQIYPIESAPRILRRMTYTRLIQAFEHPDKREEYLGKAKFWLDKYNHEFKSEADSIRATDIAEATARYTENFGMFIGKNLSKEEARKEAEKLIPKEQIFIAPDKESYEIGYVAGLILDEINPSWKESFYAAGKGVPEVLLENVASVSDEPDREMVDKITKEVDSTNQAAKVKLKDIIAAKENVDIPLLHLDVSKGSKSFYAEGMFKYQNLSVMSGYSSKFNVHGKSIEINNTAIISGYEEENQYLRIPLTMKYDIKDGILTVDSEHVKADGISVKTSTEDGRTVYSAEIQD